MRVLWVVGLWNNEGIVRSEVGRPGIVLRTGTVRRWNTIIFRGSDASGRPGETVPWLRFQMLGLEGALHSFESATELACIP